MLRVCDALLLLVVVPVRLDITDVLAGVGRALPLPETGAGLGERWVGWVRSLLLSEDVQDGTVGAAAVRVSPALQTVDLI